MLLEDSSFRLINYFFHPKIIDLLPVDEQSQESVYSKCTHFSLEVHCSGCELIKFVSLRC